MPVVERIADQLLADLLELGIEGNGCACVFLCDQAQVDEGLSLQRTYGTTSHGEGIGPLEVVRVRTWHVLRSTERYVDTSLDCKTNVFLRKIAV